jgi:putative endopeptidase
MKKTLFILLTVLMISLCMTACSSEDTQGDAEENPTAEESQDMKDYANGTPWQAIDLEGIVTEDTPVDVKDNFALYANKDDILSLKIPKDSGATGPMLDVATEVDKDILKMFQSDAPDSHDAKLAYDLYKMLLDWDSRNDVGVEPLKKQTDAVESLDTIDKLTAYLRDTPKAEQLENLWFAGTGTDYEDSDKYVIQVGNDRLLLGDSAEYSKLTDYGKVIKDAEVIRVLEILEEATEVAKSHAK